MIPRPLRCLFLLALATPPAASAACWQPDPDASEVRFSATQAGAPIEGTFRRFHGRICIDTAHPGQSSIDVSVDTASVDMGLPEFDAAMRGEEFFDSARWPAARFVSSGVRALDGDRYAVSGTFTIRDRTRNMEVPFRLSLQDGATSIQGDLKLNRLDYDIGLGEWRDTRWVGDEVTLRFRVALIPE